MPLIESLRLMRERAVDAFLLLRVEADVAARPAATVAVLRRLTQAATLRIASAEQLTGENDAVAAIALYRDAAALLAAAWVVQHDGAREAPAAVDPAGSWERLTNADLARHDAPAAVERVRPLLATNDVAAADELDPDAQRTRRTDAAVAVAWLRAHVEPRSQREVRRLRYARLAALAVGLILLLSSLVAVARLPRNVARGKPVSASSRYAGTPPAEGATNGIIESNYGVHTEIEESAWVAIDLQRTREISRIVVYSRGDGYENEGVPLALELSSDGSTYVEVARRLAPFKQPDPWIYIAGRRAARYVRVRMPQKGYIALAEIEVYGG